MAKKPSSVWMRKNSAFPTGLSVTVRSKPPSPITVLMSDNATDKADFASTEAETCKKVNDVCLQDEGPWTMKQEEVEAAFQVSAETALATEVLDPCNHIEREEYINKAFELPQDTKINIWQKARNRQYSGLKLCGKLISARDIPAMDANGKSDPYCVVGIISESLGNDEKVMRGNLRRWREGGLKVDVFRSTVKLATLAPEWNECFELPIRNLAGDIVVIEVWDSDEETVSVADIKGVKGFGQFLKDLKKQDDFIGRCFHSLNGISPEGKSLTLDLHSHSAKHQRGNIAVHLFIRGLDEGDVPLTTKMDRYMLLFKALVIYEARQGSQKYQRNWNAEMSEASKRLLLLLANYYGIDELQQAAVHLNVLYAYHKTFGLLPCTFVTALDNVVTSQTFLHASPLVKNAVPVGNCSGTPGDWADQLLSVLQRLLVDVDNILHTHLILMDMTNTSGVESLTWWIQIMMKLYQLDDLVARLPADRRCLKTTLEASIQVSVSKWYQSLYDISRLKSVVLQCYALKEASGSCLSLCETIQKTIRPAVKKLVDVDYLALYIVSMDKLLSPAVMDFTERWSQKKELVATSTYQIYLNIKSMCEVAKLVEGLRDLQMMKYQRWFKKMVPVWLKVAMDACKEKIDKAVELDKIASVTNEVRYSSSLVDTLTFLHQMVYFWHNLDWSSPDEAYTFMMELINCITEAAKYYIEQIYTRASNHTSDMDKFNVTIQLCVILNNMKHMQLMLSSEPSMDMVGLVEELKLHKTFDWLQKEVGIGDQARKLVADIMHSAAEDIENKIMCESKQLGMQFIPSISMFINGIVQPGEEATTEQVLSPLEDYLSTNLKTLSSNLLFSVFKNLLEHIWMATVDALGKSVYTIPRKPNQQYLYQRLHDTLLFLHEFFNAGGEGLTGEHLDTEQYKALLDHLELMCLSTRDLVLRCCADLAEQQTKAVGSPEHKLGELTLSVGYIKEAGNIEVTIFQGHNLPQRDSKLRNSYVKMVLLPKGYFQKGTSKNRTQLCRQTSNPTFNHECLLAVSKESMELKGTIMVLVVYNSDILGKDDFIGMCAVLCNGIPQISNKSSLLDDNSPRRRNLTLPLFLTEDSKALQELTSRHALADSEATDFLHTLSNMCGKRSLMSMLSSSSLKTMLSSAVLGAKAGLSVP